MEASRDIGQLISIMAMLRTPGSGCPWDLEQTFASIAPYTIEEAYEVADAIARGDMVDVKEELGDLLLQVVFHARMAEEAGDFSFGDVVEAITSKLIRRHPHVFGNARDLAPDEVKRLWDTIKIGEKAERRRKRVEQGLPEEQTGLLADIPGNLPALMRAEKLQGKAAKVGFDWPEAREVVAKLREELAEIEEALADKDAAAVQDEIGDLIFAAVNLARHVGGDAEAALRATNAKFERRFAAIERALGAADRSLEEATLDEMEALWQRAKEDERADSDAG
ncbi:nucleoside triphosphate pyrophosphohydrolase [Chelatococcus sp. GCM10030263]|uniref:nucleoside triphosphate pyrophosphohydrolase n=1 Tax=Chelatococcus sp. GCM10030263 TaxID=3273387 RepID=UPI00361B19C7